MKSRPTVKDIAAELKLSHPTVSRALANHASISDGTKARVRDAAHKLGYVANSSARMLKRGHSDVVGLLLPDITNEFYAAVAQKLADDCSKRSQQLVLSISADDPDRELSLVRALLEARPMSLIAALTVKPRPETLAYLRRIYCVQFMYGHSEIQGPVVTVEDSSGARIAVEHLLKLGHRRIGFVGPTPTSAIGEARLRGLNQALQTTGVQLDREFMKHGPSTASFGFEAVESLLSLRHAPTAIYLSSAPLSLGGMRSLSARGIRTPQDVSVVVAGNAAWYDVWPGGLTSITLPMEELAHAASALVLERPRRSSNSSSTNAAVSLSFRLVERGSTAPLRRGR